MPSLAIKAPFYVGQVVRETEAIVWVWAARIAERKRYDLTLKLGETDFLSDLIHQSKVRHMLTHCQHFCSSRRVQRSVQNRQTARFHWLGLKIGCRTLVDIFCVKFL